MDDTRSPRATVYRSRTLDRCREHALVLRAMGIKCEVRRTGDEFALLVHPDDATRAAQELALYARENPSQPARVEVLRPVSSGFGGALIYGATLLVVDLLQRSEAFSLHWWDAGKTQAALIRQGEWWRCLTALTLHADPVHLAGNLLFGALFGVLASQLLGSGLTWFSVLAAGAVGNGLNAFLQRSTHSSIGASTAVFGALGILCVCTWKQRPNPGHRWVQRWGPGMAGLALLGYLGIGGGRTDVVAHLTGFASGGALGVLFGYLGERLRLGPQRQLALGAAALAALGAAWVLALRAHG